MRTILFLSALALIIPVSDGQAQLLPPKTPPGGLFPTPKLAPGPTYSFRAETWPEYGLPLLEDPAIQSELKLTADQKAKIARIRKDFNDDPESKNLNDAINAARVTGREIAGAGAARGVFGATRTKFSMQALESLDPKQNTRTEQIVRQIRWKTDWILYFTSPDVQKELKLTEDQSTKIRQAFDEHEAESAKLTKKKALGQKVTTAEEAKVRKTALDKAMAVMTADQKAEWNRFLGPTFSATVKSIQFLPSR